jgi:PAS domain S-box-containing protein
MSLTQVLKENRERIIHQWTNRLHSKASERYGERPIQELFNLTAEATDANYSALVRNDFSKVDNFIEKITRLRLGEGFTLSEVQKAFDVYRSILAPILLTRLKEKELHNAVRQMNYCLGYTITQFSDYFQTLHEKQIKEYAENLEKEVENRTKELADSEAKYRILVEEINDGFFINKNGFIVFANRAFCDMHGYNLSEIIGRPYKDYIASESLKEVEKIYKRRMRGEEAEELYFYYRLHKNGNSFPTENKVKLMLYQGERIAAGICRDITERLEMERRIYENENLAHIGQLTTSLAHELRNPLSSIKMSIQMLLQTMDFQGNNRRTMEISANEISRLEKILTEMLDFARPLKMNMEWASLTEVITSSIDVLDARMKEKSLIIKKELNNCPAQLLIDKEKIEQAVINILLNAIEVLHDGGFILITVRYVSKRKSEIVVDITDNGPSIKGDDINYVFDPFFSKKKKGTGLGLSNVKKIVEAHGGRVGAENKKRGFCLWFTLPIKEAQ